jgi:hypothetical protein
MRLVSRQLSSPIELPCTVSCGEDEGIFRVEATAIGIESTRMVVRIRERKGMLPSLGDQVRLDVHLPAEAGVTAKDLSVRARIIQVSEADRGMRTFTLSFRRAQFKDRAAPAAAKRKSAGLGWEM